MNMGTPDYATIVAYALAVIFIGWLLRKKAAGSLEDYYLGGRKLPWYLLGSSGMAQWFDLTGTMVICSFLFLLGPRGLYIEFRGGAVLVLIFMLAFTGKWHRRSGVMTAAEWMKFRFGNGRDAEAARFFVAICGILMTIGMIAYLVRGTGLFLSMFFPATPTACAAVLLLIATLYTIFSGFYGVVVTDLVQAVVIIISAAVIGVGAFLLIPDAGTLSETAARVTGNENWMTSHPTWRANLPEGYKQYEWLTIFMLFYLLRNFLGGLGSGSEQKYFAAKSDKECGLLSLLVSLLIMIRWPMMMGLAVLGIFLVDRSFADPEMIARTTEAIKAFHPEVGAAAWHDLTSRIAVRPGDFSPAMIGQIRDLLGEDWAGRLALVGYHGQVNPERILPAVIHDWVPTGLKGLVIVTVTAASMSTFDSTLNAASSFAVRDLYQRWLRPAASNRELIFASYGSTIILALLGFLLGAGARSINDIWGWIIMGIGTGLMVPGILRLYWWRMNGWGVAFGLVFGATGAILQRIFLPDMDERLQFILMASIPLTATIIGCLLTPPTPDAVLDRFYRRTRPWGLWGPVRNRLSEASQQYINRENRIDLMTLPFALVYQVSLFLIPMQLVIHAFGDFWATLPLFLISCLGLYFIWYRNLPEDDPPIEELRQP